MPAAASISRSASAGERVRGRVRVRRGSCSAAAGLSPREPSSCWWRKNERTAATIGAHTIRETLGYDGSGVGVAIIDSGVDIVTKDNVDAYVAEWNKLANAQ